jgi:membrane-anchored protein YejM (alkaline phosphatase superfamily)
MFLKLNNFIPNCKIATTKSVTMFQTSKTILALSALTIAVSAATTAQETRQPNVVLIITDDQGYGDLGFTGNPHVKTPVLDHFARESIRFNQFYVSPVCAPTRASLMTGRFSLRTGVRDTYNGGCHYGARRGYHCRNAENCRIHHRGIW